MGSFNWLFPGMVMDFFSPLSYNFFLHYLAFSAFIKTSSIKFVWASSITPLAGGFRGPPNVTFKYQHSFGFSVPMGVFTLLGIGISSMMRAYSRIFALLMLKGV
ncbi:hypothetical protein VNO78_16143 [Psophocarpus tetragonolobus]|uniref:Uncharacterized protein n=1 Tax=Psophocarpus tetragonolobus TaxID=3891 RepID=A0AAN9SFS2_PSOTE